MKRKVANAAKLRLSPNEEALILKEDYERRRKLRLLQVREQERDIALQIREDIKQRRNQQFTRLAEELRAEWEDSQTQKIQNLEKLYLASLRTMGEGHRQAKENEPDLDAVARRAAERKRRAQMRHKEALKLQKNQKEILTKEKTWHIQARKEALLMEKVRSTKIASLPPPPPTLFESIDVKRTSAVKPSSSTYHHMSTFVSREKDTKQPDAHLAAEEEAKRLDELQKQAAQEKMEQYEKAHVRGFQAMQKIHLAQNQEKLMKELKQLQQEDLARRRQTVAQMPPQLVELPYKRSEMKEDWQRELEFAFEDMYNADRKVKGNLILHLEPEPLPTVTDQIQDEELDLSVEQEGLGETENLQMTEAKIISSEPEVPLTMKTKQVSSKILFKKLLNKIRSQKSLWTIKSLSEDESEMITTVNEMKSKASTSESGTGQEQDAEGDRLTIESGPLTSEDTLPSGQIDSRKEQEINETLPVTNVAQSAVLLHPQEEAARVRISARQKQIMEIEEQKQKQLELLEQIEQQKLRLEIDCFRAQLEEEKGKKTQQTEVGAATVSCTVLPDEDSHRQMIRNYQHQLLQQNRLHKQSIETARKRLLEYQSMLKRRYPSMSATSLVSDSVVLVPPQKPERLTAVSEHRDQSQRPKLSPNKYQPTQPIQISRLEHDPFQVQKQSHFPQKQAERTETLSTPDVLARQYLESQEHLRQFTQTETQQKNYKSSKPDEPSLFLPLLPQRSFTSLPIKVESGKTHKPFSTMSKSAVAESHSVISQMHYGPLPFSENITAQQNHLKVLQEQLDLHKEALQARQEAQEQLLLCKQKQLEEQIGFSLFLPLHSSASLHGAKPESGKIQESSPIKVDTALSSGDSVVPQLQDRHLSFSQPVCLPQQTNFKFLQEKLNIQKDSLQARREAQEVLYIHKQSQLDGRVDSEQAEPSHLPFQVGQHAFTSPPSTDTKSRKIQEQCLPTSEKGFLSSQYEITKSEEESSGFLQQFLPLHDSLKLLKEQLTAQRDALQARHEAQMELLLHRQRDLRDSKSGHISSFSPMIVGHSFPSQDSDAESRRIEKPYLSEKEHVSPSSHLLVPTFQDKSLSLPQHSLPQQDLTALHEQSHIQRVILGAGQETQHKQSALENIQGNTFEETGLSSFIPQLAQASSPLLPSESGATQVFLSTESDNKIPSSQFQIPELQDRLLRISQLIQPQKDNLNALQEQLATQREAIFQLRQEAQEEQLLHRESEWKGRLSPEQVATSSLPQVAQLPFTSLPLTVSERTQESCSTNSDYTISSSRSEMPRLPDRLLGLSHSVLPQQDNLISLQEHLHAQANSLPSIEKTSKEFILPRQGKYEEKVSNEHFIQTHHDDLKALQQQLDIQRKAIRSRQEVQEEVLFKRLSKLEKRVSSEQISSSSFLPLDALPFASSDRTQKSLPTESNGTLPSSHPEITRSQDRLLSFSQPIHQQGNVTAQMDLPGEVCSSKRPQEELLLNKVNKLNKSESTEHAIPTFFKETEHSFIPLPFAEAKSKSICELHSSKNEHAALPSDSVFPRFEDRLLSFSQPVLAQQDNLGLQKQLGFEREVLHCSQQAQEELQVQRQTALQQQIQKHQETLKDFFKDNQTSNSTVENDLKMQKLGHFGEWLPRIQDLASNDQENSRVDRSNSDYNQLLSEHTSAKQSGEHLDKELGRRSSKPPVAKVRCGLEVNQHELSAIQEVESPASVRTSIPGKPDFCQDRDPMRVSISREQSFLGSPLACDPLVCLQSVAQDSVCGDEHDKAATRGLTFVLVRCDHGVALSAIGTPPGIQRNAKALLIVPVQVKESEVENHAVLSFAVEEEYPRLGLIVKPDDKAETQAISPEPISSETVSTGSFLSYENIDLNLTDPEHMDYRKQESTTGKEEKTAVDLDFPELEHIFPHLHRQLFRPLEPHPDFGLSPSSSGISQDNRDFYQASDSSSEIHGATASSKRSLSLTALRTSLHSPNTSLNQQTNPDLALAAAQSFATENTEEPEQSFRQLLSEFSSQEESQHVDLPSIFSVEARYSSEGMDNQNYLSEEQTKILHNKKKSVHFQLSVENLSSVCSSSDEANVFDQVHVQHSTPCGSTSSECSIKHQLERKDKLGFEELSKRGIVTMLQSQELTENGQDEAYRVLAVNPDREEADSQLCIRTVEKGSSLQIPAIVPIQNEKCFEDSPKTETPETLRNLSQLAKSEPFLSSGSFSLQSSIPVWETESGHGIMEEPELTLVSTSDISIAETDFANLTLEEKEENEAKSCFQVSEFLPLVPETETSDHLPLSECSTDKSATVSTETLLEFTAIPGSLQEAFVKRKKSFIQRSCQRQKEIRNKIRISENSQIKTAKEKPPTGSFVNRLKGVSKVRVSVPEDRKTTHQRALRLYNQLAEVKQQKEEKAKQEAFAQNRARAKEFHKKTLQKLRAKNTW